MSALRALNDSVKWPIKPKDMAQLRGMTHEQIAALQDMALSIFTDTVNAGHTFQAALSAIYLSGMQHATEIAKEEPSP